MGGGIIKVLGADYMEFTYLTEAGINVESAMKRFMGNGALYRMMLEKFLSEESFQDLTEVVACGNGEKALERAHTLKGICGNLSMDWLYELFSEQVSLMRAGKWEEAYHMMPDITEKYENVVTGIKKWLDT